MKTKATWNVTVGFLLLSALVLAGCSSAGAGSDDDGGGGGGGASELTVTGNTEYSGDGGSTVDSASFQFTTSGLAASNTGNTVPVTGQLRAGDILFNLDGAYDPESGDFNITASGVVVNFRIEVTVTGVYDAATGAITGGTTLVSVVNTGTGETQVFRSENVGNGESSDSPISDTTGAEESDPIADGDRKFWEGVWVGQKRIYFDQNGQTTTETDYWADLTMRVVATSSQYNVYFNEDYNAAAEAFGLVDNGYYDTAIIAETISETTSEVVGITYYPNDPPGEEYWKEKIFLNPDGTIWGTSFYDDSGTPGDDNDDIESYGTIANAKNNLTSEYPVEWVFGVNNGLTRVQ